MPGKSYKTNEAINGACFDDDLLYRHLEKMTTPEEDERIEQHLNECNTCFADVTALTEIVQTPITAAERIEIARTREISPEEQVEMILDYVKARESLWAKLWERIRTLFQELGTFISDVVFSLNGKPILARQIVFATATLLIVVAGSFGTLQYYQKGYRIGKAERLLIGKHQISIAGDPQLSIDYLPSGASEPMAAKRPVPEEQSYLIEASTLTEEAIASGLKSLKARQLLAEIDIFRGNYNRADSVLQQLLKEFPNSAAALNDLGVVYFSKKEKDAPTAAQYFAAALQADPKFNKARYNLALTKIAIGEKAEAIFILNEYITFETIDGWKSAARKLIRYLETIDYR